MILYFYFIILLYFNMPQLVPFYWMNLLTTGIAALSILLYLSATIILPNVLRLLVARAIIVRV